MEHHCHARNCQTPVKPELMMYFKHWRMVPKKIQQAVWRHYRPGQCNDKDPSKEWLTAAEAAIGFVARKEGQKVRQIEQEALIQYGYSEKEKSK